MTQSERFIWIESLRSKSEADKAEQARKQIEQRKKETAFNNAMLEVSILSTMVVTPLAFTLTHGGLDG